MTVNITKPTVGASVGSWGTQINTALDAIVTEVNAHATVLGNGTFAPLSLTTQVPTLEELEFSVPVPAVTATGFYALAAPNLAQRIGALSIVTTAAITASDTDYWTVELVRYRAGVARALTFQTTKATGGTAVTGFVPWNFDLTSWQKINRHLVKGDVLGLQFTKTGLPASFAVPVVTVRYEPGVVLSYAVHDTFTRADNGTSMGTSETGQVWTPTSGTWGVSGGQAFLGSATAQAVTVVDSGLSDGWVTVTYPTVGGSWGLIFRATDDNNYFLISGASMFRKQGGSFSGALANVPGGGTFSGDTISVCLNGSSIMLFKNGDYFATVTDAFNQTATKHGLRSNSDNTTRFDEFAVVPL